MNWRTAHIPIATMAGTQSGKRNRMTSTRFVGNITRYAPRTPEIAPDAPSVGITESGSTRICAKLAITPGDEVEDEEQPVADAVLDVVAEDPQEEHVAGEVEPAAVHEHAPEQGQLDRRRPGLLRNRDGLPVDRDRLRLVRSMPVVISAGTARSRR